MGEYNIHSSKREKLRTGSHELLFQVHRTSEVHRTCS